MDQTYRLALTIVHAMAPGDITAGRGAGAIADTRTVWLVIYSNVTD